jgi:hypothetical protein
MSNSPVLSCRKLSSFSIDDWNAVTQAFRDAPFVPFQQAWLPQQTPGFCPARASARWTPDALIVYADLTDRDIFNDVTGFNAAFYEKGDVFEIFLRPADQESYFEFHVAPQNQKFQLRLPHANPFDKIDRSKSTDDILEPFKIWKPVIESRVRVDAKANRWEVVAAVPFSLVVEKTPVQPGVRWLFSFSRYDYTRGAEKPVLSSTSAHMKLSYHRLEEYGTLVFEG